MVEDNALLPATKLRKATQGDVTEAKAMQAVTGPEQLDQTPASIQQEKPVVNGEASSIATPDTSIPSGGKKRKVALYIAYIGAGYYVSS